MSLIVKIMSGCNEPDDHTTSTYRLLTGVLSVNFTRDDHGLAYAELLFDTSDDTETFELSGNVYVMNESGKTISSFGSAVPGTPT